ncbi:MAG: hypothetical protein QFX32_02690 [Methanolinea sp.]|nr:hypothetical protein [Methanolinea sp.]
MPLNYVHRLVLVLAAVSLLCVAPVPALVQETTYMGKVTALDPLSLTLTIRAESQYGCTYQGNAPACGFAPVTPMQVVGAVPDEGVYNTFRLDDTVVATILGGSGGRWAGIALVVTPPGSSTPVAKDIFGDPRTVPVPLGGDYRFEYAVRPDCGQCTGTVCRALGAQVKLWSGDLPVLERYLNSGQSAVYSGRNDGSRVSILYLSGEAAADQCPGVSPAAGVQPVSNFVIHVTPPLGGFSAPKQTVAPGVTGEGPAGTATPATPAQESTRAAGFTVAAATLAAGLAAAFLFWKGR